jgi:cellobiose-specific phosphotransferase system component IIA
MARSFSVRLVSLFLVVLASVSLLTSVSMASAQDQAKAPDVKCVCGPKRVAVLLFDFEDVKHTRTIDYYSNIVKDMNASYYRQSYGKLWLEGGEVYGWYETSFHLSSMKVTTWYLDSADAAKLRDFALTKAGSLRVADRYLFAVYAGEVWGWVLNDNPKVTVIGETRWGLRTFMHEFGHQLGLPDLYNYDKLEAEPVGEWDLMDRGSEELSAWPRVKLGWITSDSVKTVRSPVTVLVSPLNDATGIRELKVQVYAANAFYLAENRQGTNTEPSRDGTIRLVIYYIRGSIESGKGSIVFKATLSRLGDLVYIADKADWAFVLLNEQPDAALKVRITTRANGEKAQNTAQSLTSANASVNSAWKSNRVQGFAEAQLKLTEAWQAYEAGDFDSAKALAEEARQLANACVVPSSYNQYLDLRPTVMERLQNASAFKSDEAVRLRDNARDLLRRAEDSYASKDFDKALQDLQEAARMIDEAENAERAVIQSTMTTLTPSLETYGLYIAALVAIVVILLVLAAMRMRKEEGKLKE